MNRNIALALVLFAICIGIAGLVFWRTLSIEPRDPQVAQLLPHGKELSGIDLVDHFGQPFNEQRLRGQWNLVFFGFTFCPDVCPLELKKAADVLKRLDENNQTNLRILFVSVDPERDSEEQLRQYTGYFDPRIIGLTGKNVRLGEFAAMFGASYSRKAEIGEEVFLVKAGGDMPENSGEHYLVNHTSRFFLINPEGQYVGSFPPPHDTDMLFSDLSLLIRH